MYVQMFSLGLIAISKPFGLFLVTMSDGYNLWSKYVWCIIKKRTTKNHNKKKTKIYNKTDGYSRLADFKDITNCLICEHFWTLEQYSIC